jgi:hypothetical protein
MIQNGKDEAAGIEDDGIYTVGGNADSDGGEQEPYTMPLRLRGSTHTLAAVVADDACIRDYSSKAVIADVIPHVDPSALVSVHDFNDVQLQLQAEILRLERLYGNAQKEISDPVARQRAMEIDSRLKSHEASFASKRLTYNMMTDGLVSLEESMKSTGRIAQTFSIFSSIFPVTGRNVIRAIRISVERMAFAAETKGEASKDIFKLKS